MHDNSLSSSLDYYISDYSIGDNSIDKTLKNRLVNIHNEEIFMLQNDLFMNYGSEIYEKVMEEYQNELKKINFNDFNEDIWEKCFERSKWAVFPEPKNGHAGTGRPFARHRPTPAAPVF